MGDGEDVVDEVGGACGGEKRGWLWEGKRGHLVSARRTSRSAGCSDRTLNALTCASVTRTQPLYSGAVEGDELVEGGVSDRRDVEGSWRGGGGGGGGGVGVGAADELSG